jgi:hypothetical protein
LWDRGDKWLGKAAESLLLSVHPCQGGEKDKSITPIWNMIPLIVDRFFPLAHKPRVDIARPSTVRYVAGHIAEYTGLLAGGTAVGRGLGLKGIIAIQTLPVAHWFHLPRVHISIMELLDR